MSRAWDSDEFAVYRDLIMELRDRHNQLELTTLVQSEENALLVKENTELKEALADTVQQLDYVSMFQGYLISPVSLHSIRKAKDNGIKLLRNFGYE